MAQFDVYQNANSATRQTFLYLLDVQHDLLDTLATRVVVPLIRKNKVRKPARILNPEFIIEGKTVYMSTPELAGVPCKILGERVCSLQSHRGDIIRALDILIVGI